MARGRVEGRPMSLVADGRVSSRDVRVYDVGYHGDRVERAARTTYVGHGHGRWDHRDHDWWRHGRRHHVDVSFSFTYVHSYFVPARAVIYDVVPVAPVVVAPAPVFSASFAYYSASTVVSVSSVRYVYPVACAAPAVVVYPEYYAPPIITPVCFTPVVAAPVYAAPVVMPVAAPVFAPVYYYYPAYTVLSYPAYSVEPAPVVAPAVVAEPAVVEAPSSGWSISGAFGFSHHGKSYSFGGSYTKVKSEPTVLAAPAVDPAAGMLPPADTVETPAPVDGYDSSQPDGGTTADAADGSDAQASSLEAGLAAIRAGDMQEARRMLAQAIADDPGDGLARMLYTSALVADGQYQDAAEAVRRALGAWPDLGLKDFYLPSVYDNGGRFTQAMRDVREFLSDHPERVDAWLLASWSCAFSGEPQQAEPLIQEARKTWPDDPALGELLKIVQAG